MLVLLILGVFNFWNADIDKPTFWHIGYKDGRPVFLKLLPEKNEIFEMDDSLHLKKIASNLSCRPLFINDCSVASINRIKGKNMIFLEKGGQSSEIETSFEVYSISLSNDCKFLAASNSDTISFFKNGVLAYKVEGMSPAIIGNSMYYSSYKDNGDAMVSVYKSDISNPLNPDLILTNIYEPGILVFDNGNYIACNINKDGGPAKAIYNTNTKKFNLLDIVDDTDFLYPVYLPRKKSIIYYNPSGLRISKEIQVK